MNFKTITIDSIVESPTNPRKRFDEKDLAELAKSIELHGVLQPIIVRNYDGPNDDGFELVSGARRFRAAKLAGLEEIPASIVDMTDDEVLEVQIIENLQRVDVHPLDEAAGFAALLNQPGYDAAAVAARVGKSEGYVHRRVKLNECAAQVKEAFYAGKMNAGHAEVLARLRLEDQVEAFNKFWGDDDRRPPTVATLQEWVEWSLVLDLEKAHFDRADKKLTKAGACLTCPKRSGAQPGLFEDVGKELCLDKGCFEEKEAAHWEKLRAKLEKQNGRPCRLVSDRYGLVEGSPVLAAQRWEELREGETADDGEEQITAILVDSWDEDRVGQVFDAVLCPFEEDEEADDLAEQPGETDEERQAREERRKEMERDLKERQAKDAEKRKIDAEAAQRTLIAAVQAIRVDDFVPCVLDLLVTSAFTELRYVDSREDELYGAVTGVEFRGGKPKSPLDTLAQLRLVTAHALLGFMPYGGGPAKELVDFAEGVAVDFKEVRRELVAERKAAKKAQAAETTPKKAKGAKKAKKGVK